MVVAAALTVVFGAAEPRAQGVKATANLGWTSVYIFRGIPQKTSSASGGLDLAAGPVSLGTWAADVGDGSEVDFYGKLGFESGRFRGDVGGTGYFYTGGFDHRYVELNVDAGYGPLTASYAVGIHDVQPSADYWHLGLTGAYAGFSVTAGHFDYDHDRASSGNYGRVGYDVPLSDLLGLNIAWVVSDSVLSGLGRVDHTVVLSLSRTFTLN
ncbi:MAG: TorF family putative porin [Vicinamibacterales bacterium]